MMWLDGTPADPGAPIFPGTERGLLLGDGVFETMRIENGKVLLLERHMRRLARAGEVLGLPVPIDLVRDEINDAVASFQSSGASLRLTITRGSGPRGVLPPKDPQPRRLLTLAPAGPRPWAPVRACLSPIRRNEGSPLSQIKSLNYGDAILARMEAARHGATDAIMLNNQGDLACTSCANLLAYSDDGWVTPPQSAGVLGGIVREVLIEAGLVQEKRISVNDLSHLALARSNSLIGIEPLLVDHTDQPPADALKPLTEALQAAERREA